MASSPVMSSNPATSTDRSRDSKRKKKKKSQQLKQQQQQEAEDQIQSHFKWKSQSRQQIYASKLHQALARVNLGSPSAPRRGKAVREAADRALAATARGKTRWSRAILTSRRLKLKFAKQHKRAAASAQATGSSRSRKPRVSVLRLKGKSLPAVQRKVRFLGRLVPGCRKEPLPVILEEAIDYIPALEMQIRAMSELFSRLSGSASAAASTSEPPPS